MTAEPGALGNNDFVHQAGDSLDPDDAEPNEIHERGRRQPEQTPSIVVALGPAGSSSYLIQPEDHLDVATGNGDDRADALQPE